MNKKMLVPMVLFGTMIMFSNCSSKATSNITITDLRCEYRTNPLGIDTKQPRLSWIPVSDIRGQAQSAYEIIVASDKNKLTVSDADLWSTGKVNSDLTINVVYEGKDLSSGQRCYWKVRIWNRNGAVSEWSEPSWWETSLLVPEDWQGFWIGDGKPEPSREEDLYKDDPAPLFRKQFEVTKPVKSARLYISGMGYYTAYVNGEAVGDHVLDPGWTTYSERVLYSVYDVTGTLRSGGNVIGVTLGNGWYNPLPMRMWNRLNLREYLTVGRPCFIAQLNVEFEDGSRQSLITDKSWKVAEGPIIRNNIFLGEVYDARKEKPGWNAVDYDDTSWSAAVKADKPEGILQVQPQPPIRITDVIKPVDITQPEKGLYIVDMGQNFAGWVRLHVKGSAGSKVKLRYGELLYPDGTLNVYTSVAGQIKKGDKNPENEPPELAYQSDVYILKGEGEEIYVPQFTFHGFRYVEITGYPGEPSRDSIEGLRLNADVEDAGSFSCSNELFNRIQDMVKWTFLSNLFSVQSDCPHRERFGYGGDIVPTCNAFMLNFDMSSFYPKVVRDFADAARSNGGMTETAPYVGIGDSGFGEGTGPIGWVIAHPHLLDNLYRYYGNERIIRQQYEVAKRSFEVIESHAENNRIEFGIGDHESIDPKPTPLTSTAFYYDHARLLSVLAKIIGREDDAKHYAQRAEEIKDTFIATFLKPGTGQFDIHTQACQAFALHYNLLPDGERKAAFDVLVSEILDKHKGHLSTGIFATKFVLEQLSENGRADIAFDTVNRRTFPGWGYMLDNDATTLWEHWAFSDNTYSHNHPMFGSVSEWFYSALAGIRPHPDASGFDRIFIKPQITGDLTFVKCRYNSIRGAIVSDWSKENGSLTLKITVPFNTTATVFVPAGENDQITENGIPLRQNKDISFLRMEDGTAVFEVGSGSYEFVVR